MALPVSSRDADPYKSPRLSPEEALRATQLRNRLTEMRILSSEYLLRRASIARSKSGKIGWWSVWAVMVFCEYHHRFPRQGELYPYLHKVLDESRTLEDLELPPLTSLPGEDAQEAQRGTLEQLQHDVLDYKSRMSTLHSRVESNLVEIRKISADKAEISTKDYKSLLEQLYALSKP